MKKDHDTDHEWEKWGEHDPFFGVMTEDRFRSDKIDQKAIDAFYETGRQHVAQVMSVIREHVDPAFQPKKALDFGSGLGRVTEAIAEISEHVVGIDVAKSMIEKAGKRATERGIKNISYRLSDDNLSTISSESFDFIHTYIVLQHIPIERVRYIFKELVSRLDTGGIAAIQVTYAEDYYPETYGMKPLGLKARLLENYKNLKLLVKDIVHSNKQPKMEMNRHPLNQIVYSMQIAGISSFHTEFTNHGGALGIFLYFRK